MKYTGTKTYTEEDGYQIPDKDIKVLGKIVAEFDIYEDQGHMYRNNGDPGDPPVYEEELKSWKITEQATEPADVSLNPAEQDAFESYMLELVCGEELSPDYPGEDS